MPNHLARALMLMQQSRFDRSLEELQQHLGEVPEDAFAHSLQARCLVELEKYDDATAAAQTAIRLAPDSADSHYTLAVVWLSRKRLKEARAAIDEAIQLDPEDADYYAVLSQILLERRDWPGALAAAESGLAHDAEHEACNNLRAMALVKLGRREQAGQTIDAVLARNPDDAFTHANQGWTLLQQGLPRKALDHFREALRIDPTCDWAREGIVESLKARNIIYRWMLGYFFWMSHLSARLQIGLVVVGYFGYQWLAQLADARPEWRLFIVPLMIAYIVFALMTWIADPLFNLLLRLDKDGRYALSKEQIQAANALGICLAFALGSLAAYFITGSDNALLLAMMFGVGLIPLCSIWRCQAGWPRTVMIVFTIVFFSTGLAARSPIPPEIRLPFTAIHMLTMLASPWLANAIQFARVTK